MPITAIVDISTNEFVPGGHAPDATFVLKDVPRNPDPDTEKYSGVDATPIAAKTPAEIAATVAAKQDADAGLQFDGNKVFRAKCVSDLAFRLGVAPGALTPAQINTERSRIIAIYKGLP